MDEKDPFYRQKKADRKFGYFIIAVILIIGLTALCFVFFQMKNPDTIRVIAFDQIGNLKIDDPVNVIGIRVGKIKSIELRKQNVLVQVSLNGPLTLHQGYHIYNMDIGLMGDRMLSVDIGDTAKPLVPEKDTLIGTFRTGVSEAVGIAWKLQSVIDSFVELSAKLLQSTPMRASFVQRVSDIARATDSASMTLATVITNLGNGLSRQLDSLNGVIDGIARFSLRADSLTKQQLPVFEKQVGRIGSGLQKLESMVDGLLVAAGKLEGLASPDEKGDVAAFISKIKVLRDAVLHVKEGFIQLKKLAIDPS